ncbi:hypothetical protein MKW94_020579 [Papaver nudicaule]|uniref:Uncharacterized protein n=1 Tax=Papaver nudicaule TaxID=74823 RepID=A0AA41VC05_PAPNU|nr:hypothetical protein [Papaver nudicaule]
MDKSIAEEVYKELLCKNHPVNEIFVPTRAKWFDLCLEWGNKDDDAIKAHIKATTTQVYDDGRFKQNVYEIRTDNFYSDDADIGCGAILRDSCGRPIAVWSSHVPEVERVSSFYHQLEGVSLGIKLAKKYEVPQFYMYCTSEDVAEFVMVSWGRRDASCTRRRLPNAVRSDHEKAYELIIDIISDISELFSQGLSFFDVSWSERKETDGAYWLAKQGADKKMRLLEIRECEDLAECLYQDVFGLFLE